MYFLAMVTLVAVGGESTFFQQISQYREHSRADVWASNLGNWLAVLARFKLDREHKEGRARASHLPVSLLLNASLAT